MISIIDMLNTLYMEQVIEESDIKGNVCFHNNCVTCDNLINCYSEASKIEDNIDVNYGGYDTETHY